MPAEKMNAEISIEVTDQGVKRVTINLNM